MKILSDREGKIALQKLCDQALRAGGINNLHLVNNFLRSVSDLKEPPEKQKEPPKK